MLVVVKNHHKTEVRVLQQTEELTQLRHKIKIIQLQIKYIQEEVILDIQKHLHLIQDHPSTRNHIDRIKTISKEFSSQICNIPQDNPT